VSNRDFPRLNFSNSIKSLCTIVTSAARVLRAHQHGLELLDRIRLFRRQRFHDRDRAPRDRHARRSVRARDRDVFRATAGSIESALAQRARRRVVGKIRFVVSRQSRGVVIGSIERVPFTRQSERQEPMAVMMMPKLMERMQDLAVRPDDRLGVDMRDHAAGRSVDRMWGCCGHRMTEAPVLKACAPGGSKKIAAANTRAVLERLNMTQLLCASPGLLFRSAPPPRRYRPSTAAVEYANVRDR
jgi:hypothetical protein